jgi:alpha-beta hydrolase superfamily lysophospholipase
MLRRTARRAVLLIGLCLATVLGVRAWDSQRGRPLDPWHTLVPLAPEALDAADWAVYEAAEEALFDTVRSEITAQLAPDVQVPINRYFDGSPIHPGHFARDWNRSFVFEPDAEPTGAAVFLHGLTDSPYSARHLLDHYRTHGFVGIAIRLPGHGTVPGALTEITWESWTAATRLAVREARRRIGPNRPLHLIGYSNGGALAVQYALDALEDASLSRPDRILLLSPMIGVTAFARFAGLAGLPAILPAFAKAAWLSVIPEFNPFKYNSFPVNAARQSFLLSDTTRRRIAQLARDGRLADLPPILTFQSVVDFTVSTRAVIDALYAHLPTNGSELVLYDLNRSPALRLLLRSALAIEPARLLPVSPRPYRTTVLANSDPTSRAVTEHSVEAGTAIERTRPLELEFPKGVFSLSHIALPFPINDGLYGLEPDPAEDFGIQLGSLGLRGELGTLIIGLDTTLRISSNPFFPYQLERITETLAGGPDSDASRRAGPLEQVER